MPALNTDKLLQVGKPGTATTLASPGHTTGGTSITVGSTTNWPTATAVAFAIDRAELVGGQEVQIPGTYTEWIGVVTGATTIGSMTISSDSPNSDQNYSAGSLTRVYIPVSATRENKLVEWGLVHADQDGTLKADAVDVTAVIKDAVITNAKLVNDTVEIGKLHEKTSEYLADFIASGGAVAQSVGLVGTFSNIVYYIGGVRYTATSVTNKTYTASKDTYVDIGTDGTVDYNEVANGAASPALAASHIRVAKVVTSGAAITSISQVDFDSLGNRISPDNSLKAGAWDSGTTTLTVSGGTVPTYTTNERRTTVIGKTVIVSYMLLNTTGGTAGAGANPILLSLPYKAKSSTRIGSGSVYNGGTAINGSVIRNFVAVSAAGTDTVYLACDAAYNILGSDQSNANRYIYATLTYEIE